MSAHLPVSFKRFATYFNHALLFPAPSLDGICPQCHQVKARGPAANVYPHTRGGRIRVCVTGFVDGQCTALAYLNAIGFVPSHVDSSSDDIQTLSARSCKYDRKCIIVTIGYNGLIHKTTCFA